MQTSIKDLKLVGNASVLYNRLYDQQFSYHYTIANSLLYWQETKASNITAYTQTKIGYLCASEQLGHEEGSKIRPRSMSTTSSWRHVEQRKKPCRISGIKVDVRITMPDTVIS